MAGTSGFDAAWRVEGDTCLVEVRSDVDLFVSAEMRRCLEQAAASDLDLVVDLCATPFLDSAGLRELIRGHVDVTHRGHRLVVACVPGSTVARLLHFSGLTRVWEIAGSREEALAALAR